MQIKTTMSYYYIYIRMTKFKKIIKMPNVGKKWKEAVFHVNCLWDVKWHSTMENISAVSYKIKYAFII